MHHANPLILDRSQDESQGTRFILNRFEEASATHNIRPGEVHIWQATLPAPGWDEDRFLSMLSADECARMARFRFPRDRRNFLFCRSVLRILLASYLGTPPAELRFAYSAHGKPSLAAPSVYLEFNLSHSNGSLLLAVCLEGRVGVDIERVRRDLDFEGIARQFFSPRECRALAAVPENMRHDAFFACWTRKEAFVKAQGSGLSYPLDSFDVSTDSREEAPQLIPPASNTESWTLRSLNSFPGYAAAVAVESCSREAGSF